MKIHKSFRYRIYLTEEQEARLLNYEKRLIWLWNLAHEQRLAAQRRVKDNRVKVSFFTQVPEMTLLLKDAPWLAEISNTVRVGTLRDLHDAWERFCKKLARRPKFKNKYTDGIRFHLADTRSWKITGEEFYASISNPRKYAPLGNFKIVQHRPLEGISKSCSITRDGNEWYANIKCELEVPDVDNKKEKIIGIDRGVVNAIADSDGNVVENPRFFAASQKKLARLQRKLAKKDKGSKNREKARLKVARLHRKVRRQREHFSHEQSHHYVENYDVVVIEKLATANMVRSASGTVEEPGKNIAQKRGLNRAILDSGWGKFSEQLRYKAGWSGKEVIEVPAAYTSQTCSSCGYVHEENRISQSEFECLDCGVVEHADINAANNIKKSGEALAAENVPKRKKKSLGFKYRTDKCKV